MLLMQVPGGNPTGLVALIEASGGGFCLQPRWIQGPLTPTYVPGCFHLLVSNSEHLSKSKPSGIQLHMLIVSST